MQRKDLVPQHVLAGLEITRHLEGPLEAALNEIVDDPGLEPVCACGSAGLEGLLRDLDELEFLLLYGGAARCRTGGEVVDDGTDVALGPGVPLQRDVVAGADVDVVLPRGGRLVTDDVGVLEALRGHEADVRVVGVPSWHGGRWALEPEARVVAAVPRPAGVDVLHEAVGGDALGREEDCGSESEKHRDVGTWFESMRTYQAITAGVWARGYAERYRCRAA